MLPTLVLVAGLVFQAPLQPASEQDQKEGLRHYRAGQELLLGEQFEKAVDEFQQAIHLDPLLTLAYYGLGQAHMGLKNYPSAIRAFTGCRDAYVRIFQLSGSATQSREQLIAQEITELNDSLRLLNDPRMKANPIAAQKIEQRIRDLEREKGRGLTGSQHQAPAEVLLALGSAYFRNGNLEEAEKEYRASIEANPKLAEAHNNLAAICLITKRYDEADAEAKLAEKNGFRVNPQMKEDIKKGRQGS